MQPKDFEAVRALHAKAEYGFDLPEFLVTSFVVESEGHVVAWGGAELVAEAYGVVDPEWGTPARKMEAFEQLMQANARAVRRKGIRRAIAFLDPKYAGFARHLMQRGFRKALWEPLVLELRDILCA